MSRIVSAASAFVLALTLGLMLPALASAEVSYRTNYQGLLVDDLGDLINADVDITIRLWNDGASANPLDVLYEEDHLATPVVDGVFAIEIGTGTPVGGGYDDATLAVPEVWLEVEAGGETLSPRSELVSVPYALRTAVSQDSEGLEGESLADVISQAQVGVVTNGDLAAHTANASAHHTKTTTFPELSGQAAGGQIPANITRDAELAAAIADLIGKVDVFPVVLDNDGPGSGLNADLLDGINSTAFALDSEVDNIILANDGAGSLLDADFLDGLNSTRFLRSDASDVYTAGTLTFNPGTFTRVNGQLQIGTESAVDDDQIFFDANVEVFFWDESKTAFSLSDSLHITSDTPTYSTLLVGPTSLTPGSYNRMSATATEPLSGALQNSGDLFVQFDLEIGASLFLDRFVYMRGDPATGGDSDQVIYFYDNNSRTAESFRWDDSESEFAFSDDLRVDATLQLSNTIYMHGQTTGADVDQNVYFYDGGSRGAETLRWDDSEDEFWISDHLFVSQGGVETSGTVESIGRMLTADSLVVGYSTATTFSYTRFASSDTAAPVAGLMNSDHDLYLQDDLEVADDIYVGSGTTSGSVSTPRLIVRGGSDLSEGFAISPDSAGDGGAATDEPGVEPGTVVCIDPANAGSLRRCQGSYDRTVAGVVSGANGIQVGMLMGQEGSVANGDHPVALTGRVYVKADAGQGAIQPGDLLTSSNVPGLAMRVGDYGRAQGAILGKAMTGLAEGQDFVLVLVSLQ